MTENDTDELLDDGQSIEWEGVIKSQLNSDQHKQLKMKVFEKDLLEGTLIGNLLKTFVMPIY